MTTYIDTPLPFDHPAEEPPAPMPPRPHPADTHRCVRLDITGACDDCGATP